MADIMDLLLKADVPNLPEKTVKMKRLSDLCGGDVEFTLRAVPYNRLVECNVIDVPGEGDIQVILASIVSPNLKSRELMEKYGVHTPSDLVKKMLLPGEISALVRTVDILSGFRVKVLEEVKKK